MSRTKPIFQDGIIKQLANKYNVPEEKVSEAVYYQFKFVANTIKKGKFESVRLRRFGKFDVNPKRLKHLQNGQEN